MSRRVKASGRELHGLFEEVFHLRAVLATVVDQVHEEAGLGSPHKRVAEILSRRGPSTVPEVAAEMEVSRQFARTVCNSLEEQGLIGFGPNPRHKRSRLAGLTELGRATLDRVWQREGEIIQAALPQVAREPVLAATETLRCLTGRLREALAQKE